MTAPAIALLALLVDAGTTLPTPMVKLPGDSTFVGTRPGVADFDQDGRLDLAVGSATSVAVALRAADGRFEPLTEVPGLTGDSFAVDVGDLDGDGNADLVASAEAAGQVRVALGLGDGSFAAPVAYAVGVDPENVALADLTGDGALDAVTINGANNDTTVLIGQGDGAFAVQPGPSAGGNPIDLELAEATGDAHVDLLIARSTGLALYPGQGNGSFGAPTVVASGLMRGATVADLDGDLVPDLVIARQAPDQVLVAIGLGGGAFDAPIALDPGSEPWDVQVADFDEDGVPDVVSADIVSQTLSIFDGLGGGAFATARTLAVRGPAGLTPADLDGDGDLDLVVASRTPPSMALLLVGDGAGGFELPGTYDADHSPLASALGDLDGDGVLDVVTAGRSPYTGSIALGLGAGDFGAPQSFDVGFGSVDVAVGSFDGDAHADVAVLDGFDEEVRIYLGQGDGTVVAGGVIPVGLEVARLAVADLDQDGTDDLAIATRQPTFPNSLAGHVTVALGLGDGTFGPLASGMIGYPPKDIAVADLDQDLVPDLVLSTNDGVSFGDLAVLLGQGDGTFAFPPLLSSAGIAPAELALGHFDPDGNVDVAVLNRDAQPFQPDRLVSLLHGQGDGTFTLCCEFGFDWGSTSQNPVAIAAADVTGDGFSDVLVPLGSARRAVAIFESQGGALAGPRFVLGPNQPTDVSTGDLDGDGLVDVVVADDLVDGSWVYRGAPVGPLVYCQAATSSAGCVAQIATSDAAQPSSGDGDYVVSASGVQELKNGLLFASVNGQASIPFGSGILCMNPPLKRGPVQGSGGVAPSGCNGGFATVVNDGLVIPSGLDAGPGNTAQYQYYYRDPLNAPAGTALSDAVELCFTSGR